MTDANYTDAKIKYINTYRIWKELEKNDVIIIAGFQGIDNYGNITTLGRDGSDTSAVTLATFLKQKECYIFTDTDGIYTKDPKQYADATKLERISYSDMQKLSQSGAKVLHDRCIDIAKQNNIKIIVKSTFSNNEGSIVEN